MVTRSPRFVGYGTDFSGMTAIEAWRALTSEQLSEYKSQKLTAGNSCCVIILTYVTYTYMYTFLYSLQNSIDHFAKREVYSKRLAICLRHTQPVAGVHHVILINSFDRKMTSSSDTIIHKNIKNYCCIRISRNGSISLQFITNISSKYGCTANIASVNSYNKTN